MIPVQFAQYRNFRIFVIQILREVNFGEFRSSKNANFDILGALNFVGSFQPSKSAKIHKYQNSEPRNILE